jgi:hypothetical protein
VTADEIKALLNLVPLPEEGGFFAETHRCEALVPKDALPDAYTGARNAGTTIYYLITPEDVSLMHRLPSEEVFHFYLGDPVLQLHLRPGGTGEEVTIGTDLGAGQRPQVIVPGDVWQGARLAPGGRFALLGCTVTPGFDYDDYEHGERAPLLEKWPAFKDEIRALTRA